MSGSVRTRATVIIVALLMVTGCGTDGDNRASAEDEAYLVPATMTAEIAATGINITGRSDITEEQWMAIATRACNEEGWDWDVAARIAGEMIGEPHPNADPGSGATAVWLIVAAGCHELIPTDAIELGPPQP
jgi:hypothetical protein